jgi:serine/threonine protein kinase
VPYADKAEDMLVTIWMPGASTHSAWIYLVLKPLKSGGMGAVYLLHDSRLERKCVLKEMVPTSHGYLTEFVESREKDYSSGRKVSRCNS